MAELGNVGKRRLAIDKTAEELAEKILSLSTSSFKEGVETTSLESYTFFVTRFPNGDFLLSVMRDKHTGRKLIISGSLTNDKSKIDYAEIVLIDPKHWESIRKTLYGR